MRETSPNPAGVLTSAPSWHGVFSVLVTPFTDSGALDLETFERLVDRAAVDDANGIIVSGSTGEFYSLTNDERIALLETAVMSAKGRMAVIGGANSGNISTAETVNLAKRCADAGVDGIMLLPPIFVRPNENEIIRFYRDVGAGIDIPIMAYNNPGRTGCNLTLSILEKLVSTGAISALKDSSANLDHLARVVATLGDDLSVFTGFDNLIVPSAAVGAHGVASMLHQVVGTHVVSTWRAAMDGSFNDARSLQSPIGEFYTAMYGKQSAPYAVLKYAMAQAGLPVGPPRPPLEAITPDDARLVDSLLLAFSHIKAN